jgi:hypothetical protein
MLTLVQAHMKELQEFNQHWDQKAEDRDWRTNQCQCQPFHGHRDTTSNMTTSDKKT